MCCCTAPLKFLLSFQLHILVHFWSFYSLSSKKIVFLFPFCYLNFLFLVKVSLLCLFLCCLLLSSHYRRAISSSAWLCLTLPPAKEGCRKRDGESQMSLGQWPEDCQRDVAPLPPCTRGINKRQSTHSLGQTFVEFDRQEKLLQYYPTDISQADGEMVKTQLS